MHSENRRVGAQIEVLAALPDGLLHRPIELDGEARPLQFHLYAALRREQSAAVAAERPEGCESLRILGFAEAARAELAVVLAGREDAQLDRARDGDWTLRDLLRHAIAVELRYCAQVLWSAHRADRDPLPIPPGRLPCDRMTPPDPDFAGTATAGVGRILDLLGLARRRTDAQLADLSDDLLVRPSLWGDAHVDVRERIHQIAAHLVEVIIQAEKMLGTTTESEARRICRRIAYTRGLHHVLGDPHRSDALDIRLAELAAAASRIS